MNRAYPVDVAQADIHRRPDMGRYKWALIGGTLVALALVVIGVGLIVNSRTQFNQQVDRGVASLTLQAFCYGHVAIDDSGCSAWSALVLNSGSNYEAVTECDRTYRQNSRRFADCLEQNGFTAPLK